MDVWIGEIWAGRLRCATVLLIPPAIARGKGIDRWHHALKVCRQALRRHVAACCSFGIRNPICPSHALGLGHRHRGQSAVRGTLPMPTGTQSHAFRSSLLSMRGPRGRPRHGCDVIVTLISAHRLLLVVFSFCSGGDHGDDYGCCIESAER